MERKEKLIFQRRHGYSNAVERIPRADPRRQGTYTNTVTSEVAQRKPEERNTFEWWLRVYDLGASTALSSGPSPVA